MEYLNKQSVKFLQKKGFAPSCAINTSFDFMIRLFEQWGKIRYKNGYKKGYREALKIDKSEL